MKNEIVLYRPNELAGHVEVRFDEDTVWLTQAQIVALFSKTKQNISLHINNVFNEASLYQVWLSRNTSQPLNMVQSKEKRRQ